MSNHNSKAKRHKFGVDRRRILHSSYVWHRRLGLAICVLVLWLSITGLALNHNEGLRLDEKHIPTSWASAVYGVEPESARAWQLGTQWLLATDDFVHFAGAQTSISNQLVGAIALDGLVIAATSSELLLFTDAGELVERVDSGFPPPLFAIGLFQQNIAVNSSAGPMATTVDFLSWEKLPHNSAIDWSLSTTPPSELAASLPQQNGISWERFLLDIHAGRILGKARLVIADIAAIGMILLSLTGLYTWFTRYRRKR